MQLLHKFIIDAGVQLMQVTIDDSYYLVPTLIGLLILQRKCPFKFN